MSSSVRTKNSKKQPAFEAASQANAPNGALSVEEQSRLESSVMELEQACMNILLQYPVPGNTHTDTREQARVLKNIATPLSLALRECEGVRRFHNHYRHDPQDPDLLKPVLEPSPYQMVAALCEQAVSKLSEFHVVESDELRNEISLLKHALSTYLADYREIAD